MYDTLGYGKSSYSGTLKSNKLLAVLVHCSEAVGELLPSARLKDEDDPTGWTWVKLPFIPERVFDDGIPAREEWEILVVESGATEIEDLAVYQDGEQIPLTELAGVDTETANQTLAQHSTDTAVERPAIDNTTQSDTDHTGSPVNNSIDALDQLDLPDLGRDRGED